LLRGSSHRAPFQDVNASSERFVQGAHGAEFGAQVGQQVSQGGWVGLCGCPPLIREADPVLAIQLENAVRVVLLVLPRDQLQGLSNQ
jgi:hypothetical protein